MTPEQRRLDVLLRDVYGYGLNTRPRRGEREARPLRRCSRCGIDTRRPDLCVDCQDAP